MTPRLDRWFAGVLLMVVALCGVGSVAAELKPAKAKYPPLPDKISSFGAAVAGDALYVYSGHIGKAHDHSRENLSLKFSRLRLNAPSEWEALPVGPGLQSPALVAYQGKLYRVGGMFARNAPTESEDLVSVADFERFDPQTNKWTALTPLPAARSSHDAVVVGDLLYVVGGWKLGEEEWHDTALVCDLSEANPTWKELPKQPFKRRALAAAVVDGKIYAIGGMSEDGPSLDVHAYDPKTKKWTEGPKVPSVTVKDHGGMAGMNGFGCTAFGVDGKLYLSTMDGTVSCLAEDGKSWKSVGKLETPRFFHRLLPYEGGLLAVGGASRGGHLDSIERFEPARAAR